MDVANKFGEGSDVDELNGEICQRNQLGFTRRHCNAMLSMARMSDSTTTEEHDVAGDGARSTPVAICKRMQLGITLIREAGTNVTRATKVHQYAHQAVVEPLGRKR